MPSPSAAAGGNVIHVIIPYALNSRFFKYIFLCITVFTQSRTALALLTQSWTVLVLLTKVEQF